MLTMSALPRVLNCTASVVLPRAEAHNEYADVGRDEHEELARFEDLPPHLAALLPPGAIAEVKVAYDVATRVGRIVGAAAGRGYGELGPFEIAGSIDALGVDREDGVVVIVDWKTGYADVDPAVRNWQLWGYALAACRALGYDRARLIVAYTNRGRIDQHELDALDLADFAERLERLHARVGSLKAARDRGETLDTREGPWCRHCASKPFCPSKNALLVQVAEKGLAVIGDAYMTPERARGAYEQVIAVEQLVKEARKRLERYVDERGPIDLGDGRAFGRHERQGNERVDARVARKAIYEIAGELAADFAEVALDLTTSKAAIDRAAKSVGEPKLAKAVLGRTRALGGIKSETKLPVGEFQLDKHRAAAAPEFPANDVDRALSEAS